MTLTTLLQPGDRIADYVIERALGAGGMAEVHRARRPGGPAVALKLITTKLVDDEHGARFEREIAAAARLDHRGCVRVLDHGRSPRGPFLVNELLGGTNLRARMDAGPVVPRVAVRLADELLAALEHAHARGVVHRDVKPDNAMFRRRDVDGDLVLIDFGLARAQGDVAITVAGTCAGSPSYLAPERVLGQPADPRSDLYAVGVILFELLAGRPPFVGATPTAILRLQVSGAVPDLAALCPGLAPELTAVVRRALAKDPADRFPHATAMRAALEDAIGAPADLAIELDDADLAALLATPPPIPRPTPRT